MDLIRTLRCEIKQFDGLPNNVRMESSEFGEIVAEDRQKMSTTGIRGDSAGSYWRHSFADRCGTATVQYQSSVSVEHGGTRAENAGEAGVNRNWGYRRSYVTIKKRDR